MQEAYHEVGGPTKEAEEQLARLNRADISQKINPLFDVAEKSKAIKPRDIPRLIQGSVEGTVHKLPDQLYSSAGQVGDLTSQIKENTARQIAQAKEWGAPVGEHKSQWGNDYLHRESTNAYPGNLQIGAADKPARRLLPTTTGSSLHREAAFELPGGANQVNDLMRELAGLHPEDIAPGTGGLLAPLRPPTADLIQRSAPLGLKVRDVISQRLTDAAQAKSLPVELYRDALNEQAKAFGKKIANTSQSYRGEAAQPFFSENLAQTEHNRNLQHARQMASVKTMIRALANGAQEINENATPTMLADSGIIPLHKAVEKLGLKTNPFSTGEEEWLKHGPPAPGTAPIPTPNQGAMVQLHKMLAPHGASMTSDLLYQPLQDTTKAGLGIANELSRFGIHQNAFQDIAKDYARLTAPEQLKGPLSFLNSWTNMFKGLAYPGFIPSHVRNSGTAFVNNAIEAGPINAIKDVIEQSKVMRGNTGDLSHIPGVVGNTPSEQLASLRRLQAGAKIGENEGLMNNEIVGAGSEVKNHLRPGLPGTGYVGKTGSVAGDIADLYVNQGLWGTAKNLAKTTRDIAAGVSPWRSTGTNLESVSKSLVENLGMRGVAGATEDTLPLVKAGRRMGESTETAWRGAMFNRALKEGATPEVARDLVNKYHFDYGNMTDFEKKFMRTLVPFYTFTRKNLPLQLEHLTSNPGRITNQYRPFYQHSQAQPPGYVPEYLNSGAAIPVGGVTPEGNQQFISKLGLPEEEALEHLHFKNGVPDVGNTLLDYAGGINPAIRWPLEQLFNLQFHSQRKLSDLRAQGAAGAIGRTFGDENPQLLGQIFANSPFTRFFSTADKIIDPRKSALQKAINLASGVQVSDVNLDKQKAAETRDALIKILQEHPRIRQFTNMYAKKEDLPKLTPEEVQLMRKWHELTDRSKAFHRTESAQGF
jgi:hypothetical protein